jgi:hypothetical protein
LVVGSIPACGASFRIVTAKTNFTFYGKKEILSCCIFSVW